MHRIMNQFHQVPIQLTPRLKVCSEQEGSPLSRVSQTLYSKEIV